jgi:hypothetical protein
MREGGPLDSDGPDQTATEYAVMRRLTPYLLLGVLTLGTGAGLGLGLSGGLDVRSPQEGSSRSNPWSVRSSQMGRA